MLFALLALMWVVEPEVIKADEELGDFSALSFEELCVQHAVLSDRLSRDFIRMKMSQLEEAPAEDQIAARATYNRTVADLNAITLALGTRTCPSMEEASELPAENAADDEEEAFPPLL